MGMFGVGGTESLRHAHLTLLAQLVLLDVAPIRSRYLQD